jgi:hypothetical protein
VRRTVLIGHVSYLLLYFLVGLMLYVLQGPSAIEVSLKGPFPISLCANQSHPPRLNDTKKGNANTTPRDDAISSLKYTKMSGLA